MSAETTLRPLLAQYIHEADSLDTAFSESTTDLFLWGWTQWALLPCSMTSRARGLLSNSLNW